MVRVRSWVRFPVSASLLRNFPIKMKKNLLIDIGSFSFRAFVEWTNKTYSIPNFATKDLENNEFTDFGKSSLDSKGKTGKSYEVVKPFAKGVIVDYDAMNYLIKNFYSLIGLNDKFSFQKIDIYCLVHNVINEVQLSALSEALSYRNVGKIYFVTKSLATNYYIKKDSNSHNSNLLIDIGNELTELSVIRRNSYISYKAIDFGMDQLIKGVIRFNIGKYNKEISENKAFEFLESEKNDQEIKEILKDITGDLLKEIDLFLGSQKLEINEDIEEEGFHITGGGARYLSSVISKWASRKNLKIFSHNDSDVPLEGLKLLLNDTATLDKVKIKDFILR